jgi:signal transduction histidine kinase
MLPTRQGLPFYRSIGFTLTVIFLVLAILPSAIFAALVIDRANRQARDQAQNQMESVASIKTEEVKNWLEGGRTVLRLTALAEDNEWAESLTDTLSDQEVERENGELQEQLARQNVFAEFFVFSPSGQVFFATDPVEVGKSVRLQPYFEDSLLASHVEVPYYDVASSSLVIIFSEPIRNESNQVIGVLAGRANVDELSAIMTNRTGLGETGETYLVSQENNYLVTPSRFEGFQQNRAYRSLAIDQALAGVNGAGLYDDYRDVPVIGAYRWLPTIELALVSEINDAEALQAGRAIRDQALVTALGLALAAVMIGLAAARWLSVPLVRLTRTAEAVAAGDYQQRVEVQRQNEIGVLGQSFNHMADELVKKIAELDQHLHELDETNHALKVATIKAKESARLKGEFLSTMSHELRTPLNAMEGFTSIILSKMGGADYNDMTERYLQRIDANNKRLLTLINDFLDLSRIESGRMELVQKPFDVLALVKQWQEQISVLAEKRGLQLEVQVDPTLPSTLLGDPEALSKIAFNLLSNAVKFTEQGQVRLEVNAADSQWLIQVSDSGIGIPSHAREYIFEEFRQADQSSKRKYGGTGLGLAIVQKLARLMDGTITLKSEVGKGSTFTLTLPLLTPLAQ